MLKRTLRILVPRSWSGLSRAFQSEINAGRTASDNTSYRSARSAERIESWQMKVADFAHSVPRSHAVTGPENRNFNSLGTDRQLPH